MNLSYSPNVKVIRNDLFNLDNYSKSARLIVHPNNIIEINLLNIPTIDLIKSHFNILFDKEKEFIETVNVSGLKDDTNIGSYRISTNSNGLSIYLSSVLHSFLWSATWNDKEYNHVANYFRFMKYESGGQHFPHYDSDYKLDEEKVTTHSLVMYLDDCENGELIFCNDDRENLEERKASNDIFQLDWSRQALVEEIYFKFKPKAGSIIIFPHELCHGVFPFNGEQRRIIRGDLIFS